MELPSVGMIKAFVTAGVGVSLISASFASQEVESGQARLIPVEDVAVWRELGIVHRTDRTLPRAAIAFIELIRGRTTLRSKKAIGPA
jgi:DNA-binding transcriptional LysR family regulator